MVFVRAAGQSAVVGPPGRPPLDGDGDGQNLRQADRPALGEELRHSVASGLATTPATGDHAPLAPQDAGWVADAGCGAVDLDGWLALAAHG